MTKGKTKKEQRIEAEKAALSIRLFDMLAGAAHGMSLQGAEDDDGAVDYLITSSVGLEEMAGWMRAAKNCLTFDRDDERWPGPQTDEELVARAFSLDNLRHFDTLNNATKHLYDWGFRA
jgi:hypothetical protein